MMKTRIPACLFALLALGSTSAGASDMTPVEGPITLSENQMDRVSAGQISWSFGSASALSGIARSNSQTYAIAYGPLRFTSATTSSYAFGYGTSADAQAGSGF